MKTKTPCIDCPNRTATCHAECEPYLTWARETREYNQMITEKKIEQSSKSAKWTDTRRRKVYGRDRHK